MLLTPPEIDRCQALVASAFPRFTGWEFVNQIDAHHPGFCLWGRYCPDPNDRWATRFFVALAAWTDTWSASLTVGKHGYFWSSASIGDATLLSTKSFATPEEAIADLKRQINGLCAALVAGQ